jgi:monoamine oxidase
MSHTKTVLIIGSGVSGISAARVMKENNIPFKIIEARERYGGRVNPVVVSDTYCDMGASWAYRVESHPLMVAYREDKVDDPLYMLPDISNPLIKTIEMKSIAVFDQLTGSRINPSDVQDSEDFFNVLLKNKCHGKNDTLMDKLEGGINGKFDAMDRRFFELNISRVEGWSGMPVELTPPMDGIEDLEYDGPVWDYVFRYSYSDCLKNFVDPVLDHIEYNKEVVGITTLNNNKIAVSTADGSHYIADFVICTVPLGVLKTRSITFSPELPFEKYNAMDKLEMGLLNKIYMFFDCEKPFWPPEVDVLCIALEENGYKEQANIYISLFQSAGKVALWAMIAAEFADKSEEMEDEELVRHVLKPLRIFPNCPDMPKTYFRTKWRSDKYAYGSYSCYGLYSDVSDRVTIAKPIGNLHFAGEACHLDTPACVDGAAHNGREVGETVCAKIFSQPKL